MIATLLDVSVGNDSGRAVKSGVFAAHGDDRNLGKSTPDDREQLKSGHSGHIQVAYDDIGKGLLHHRKRLKSVFGTTYGVAKAAEQVIRYFAEGSVIVDD
jgi:hypothetical protein